MYAYDIVTRVRGFPVRRVGGALRAYTHACARTQVPGRTNSGVHSIDVPCPYRARWRECFEA